MRRSPLLESPKAGSGVISLGALVLLDSFEAYDTGMLHSVFEALSLITTVYLPGLRPEKLLSAKPPSPLTLIDLDAPWSSTTVAVYDLSGLESLPRGLMSVTDEQNTASFWPYYTL